MKFGLQINLRTIVIATTLVAILLAVRNLRPTPNIYVELTVASASVEGEQVSWDDLAESVLVQEQWRRLWWVDSQIRLAVDRDVDQIKLVQAIIDLNNVTSDGLLIVPVERSLPH
ncbi:MAG: hypothetical protein AAFN77_02695 [Planctomycetota bacterium]